VKELDDQEREEDPQAGPQQPQHHLRPNRGRANEEDVLPFLSVRYFNYF
jgi:hypothetical protein